MAETLFGFLKICFSGYRHPPEALGEAEGLFFAKCYRTIQGYFWYEPKFEFMKGVSQKAIVL